jgi:ABC-type sulfate/molybdate transport systems ATPase subunit
VRPSLDIQRLQVVRGGRTTLAAEGLAVEAGGVLALLGANGAGKTTLLHAVAGLLRAEGVVRLDGVERSAEERRRLTALVLQRPVLARGSVAANAALGLRLRGVRRRAAVPRARAALQQVGLDDLAGRDARTLSGGEAQRLALARALAVSPAVLLLDEPTAHLDAVARADVQEQLRRLLHDAGGPTALLVTHDWREAVRLGTALAVLDGGRVVQAGPVAAMRDHPATPVAARLLGFANVLPAGAVDAAARDGELVAVRPGDLRLGPAREGEVRLAGRLVRFEDRGDLVRAVVETSAGRVLVDALRLPELAAGERVEVALDPRDAAPMAYRSDDGTHDGRTNG